MAQPSLYDKLKGSSLLPMLEMNHELADKMMAVFRRILLSSKVKNVATRQIAITGPYHDSEDRIYFKVHYGKENPGKAI